MTTPPVSRTEPSQHYRLEPLSAEQEARWDDLLLSCTGHHVFHRRAWLDYLAESRGITTRLWQVSDPEGAVGYFCGGTLKKGPFRILGSPLTGWGTNTLGPVFKRGDADHAAFLAALDALAQAERLATIELESTLLSEGALEAAGFEPTAAWTYLVHLDAFDSGATWRRLSGPCRNRIRRALSEGLRVEATDDPAFVDDYYAQYAGVMRRKGMRPHYPIDYPRALFSHLQKNGSVLALQVKDKADRAVASGLFPYDERGLYFWGAASAHESLDQCPNELLHWTAMQLAAEKGLTTYNMSGHGRFKKKFGGTLTLVKRWHKHYWRSAGWARRGYRLWLDLQTRPARRSAEAPEAESRQTDEFIDVMKDARRNLSRRPSYPWSDLWRAPLHHFPIRDEIIHQCLPLRSDMDVLEIGPGAGFTAFRVARRVRHLSLLDIAPGNIAHLEKTLQGASNLDFVCADICRPGLAGQFGRQFDVVYAIEVFELVPDPATALANMAGLLRRGGRLVLQFPNYPPPKNPGPTYFPTRESLDRMMRDAGFEVWTVHSLKLGRYPQQLVNTFLERPLALYRRFKQRAASSGQPLAYDETWAFQNRASVDRYKYAIHSAWAVLTGAMRLGGPCFERRLLGDNILNSNLLVLAQR